MYNTFLHSFPLSYSGPKAAQETVDHAGIARFHGFFLWMCSKSVLCFACWDLSRSLTTMSFRAGDRCRYSVPLRPGQSLRSWGLSRGMGISQTYHVPCLRLPRQCAHCLAMTRVVAGPLRITNYELRIVTDNSHPRNRIKLQRTTHISTTRFISFQDCRRNS